MTPSFLINYAVNRFRLVTACFWLPSTLKKFEIEQREAEQQFLEEEARKKLSEKVSENEEEEKLCGDQEEEKEDTGCDNEEKKDK